MPKKGHGRNNNGSFNRERKDRIRAELMVRDGWFCWICGMEFIPFFDYLVMSYERSQTPTNRQGSIPDNYPTLDHILERREGGSNRTVNLKLACPDCNNKRSNDSNSLYHRKSGKH